MLSFLTTAICALRPLKNLLQSPGANAEQVVGELSKPVEDLFIVPNYTLIIVLILIFAFLVFIFFSWHTAFFYIENELFFSVTKPFSHAVEPPEAPEKEGFRFVSWCKDIELLEPCEMPYIIRMFNVKFYAKFEPLSEESESKTAEELPENSDITETEASA